MDKLEQMLDLELQKVTYIHFRKKLPYLNYFIVLFVFPMAFFLLVSFIEGSLFMGASRRIFAESKADDLGFLENSLRMIVVFVHSLTIYFVIAFTRKSLQFFESLKNIVYKNNHEVIDRNILKFIQFVTFKNKAAKRWKNGLHVIGLLSIVYNWIVYEFGLGNTVFSNFWSDKYHPLGFAAWLFYLILSNLIFYPICMCLIFSVLITIKNIFTELKSKGSYHIKLYPSHGYDESWECMRKLSKQLYICFIPIIAYILIYMMQQIFDNLFAAAFLLLLIPCAYIAIFPIIVTHKVLKRVKQKTLNKLGQNFNMVFMELKKTLEENSQSELMTVSYLHRKLEYYEKLIRVQKKIPVWILRFPKFSIPAIVTSILSPLITQIILKII